jgi:hypothetical protein
MLIFVFIVCLLDMLDALQVDYWRANLRQEIKKSNDGLRTISITRRLIQRVEKLSEFEQCRQRTIRLFSQNKSLAISLVSHPNRKQCPTRIQEPNRVEAITSSRDCVKNLNFTIVQRMPRVVDFHKTAFMGFVNPSPH